MKQFICEKGSVLTAALGVVALVGILSYSAYNLLSGPVRTTANVTAVNKTRNDMIIAARLLMRQADDSLDSDSTIEPPAFIDPGAGDSPNNGGYLPNIGVSTTDPWRTTYGYCVWDHGSSTSGANYLVGTTSPGTEIVLAVISAGPDRSFSTTCNTAPATVTAGGDDLVQAYSYAEAEVLEGGLWSRVGATNVIEYAVDDVQVTNDFDVTGVATLNTADIDAGNIDDTVIGATVPAAGSFTTLNANSASIATTLTANGVNTNSLTVNTALLASGPIITISDSDGGGNMNGINIGSTLPGDATFNEIFQVTSTNLVENLNADLLDGQHGAYYTNASNISSGTLSGSQLPALNGGDVRMLAGDPSSMTVIGFQGRGFLPTPPATDQVIGWNGSFWAPLTISGSGGGGDVVIAETDPNVDPKFLDADNSCSLGQVTKYDGTDWVCANDDSTTGTADAVKLPIDIDLATTPPGVVMDVNGGANSFLSVSGTNNVFLGQSSGDANSTGSQNSFFGQTAGETNSSGSDNVFLGFSSGNSNDTGLQNIYIGSESSSQAMSASENVGIGYQSLLENVSGSNNVVIGQEAARDANSVSNSTIIGYMTAINSATIDETTIIGYQAGQNVSGVNNTFIGHQSGQSNNSGAGNTFLGYQSGQINSSGAGNTFLGRQSGISNTTGSSNTFVGDGAGQNSTASENTFIGYQAGLSNTNGNNNTFIGHEVAANNVSGGQNVVIGNSAANLASGVSTSVIIGHEAASTTTSAVTNSTVVGFEAGEAIDNAGSTLIGYRAGARLSTGENNTFVGEQAGRLTLSTSDNSFFGKNAGFGNQSEGNTLIGAFAGDSVGTGRDNTFVGRYSGDNTSGGRENTFMGAYAGADNSLGSRNIAIGANSVTVGVSPSGVNDNLNIGNTIYGKMSPTGSQTLNNGDASITIDGDLTLTGRGSIKVPVGTTAQRPTTPTEGMIRYKTSATAGFEVYESGSWVAMGASVSDKRSKQDINQLDGDKILKQLQNIGAYSYRFKNDPERTRYGVIAQEIEEVFPGMVDQPANANEMKSIRYMDMVGPLLSAVQTLSAQNDTLRKEIEIIKENQERILNDSFKSRVEVKSSFIRYKILNIVLSVFVFVLLIFFSFNFYIKLSNRKND